jgi:hypothetical protein
VNDSSAVQKVETAQEVIENNDDMVLTELFSVEVEHVEQRKVYVLHYETHFDYFSLLYHLDAFHLSDEAALAKLLQNLYFSEQQS